MTQTAQVTCKAGSFPGGSIKSYTLDSGATIREFLRAAGIDGDNKDVRVGGVKVENLDTTPKDGDQILIFGNVRGN